MNVFGWFLSIRGPDAEESIYHEGGFSHLETHRLGVRLLAPRDEKLHFEGAGLTKHRPIRSSEPPLTPEQREKWINAFKTLAANLRYRSPVSGISLFYFANCPLPYKADSMLDTALALEYCEKLQPLLSEDSWFESTDKNDKPDKKHLEVKWGGNQESRRIYELTIKENLSRAVYHIHTCLTMRVEHVQQSCMDVSRSVHTFYGTPFNIPKVVTVLDDLAKLYKEKLGADAPELLPPPGY